MNTEERVVNAAKKLLKLFGPKGEHWTVGNDAVDKEGVPVEIKSRRAVKWCLGGGIEKARISPTAYEEIQRRLGGGFASFNDSHKTFTHVRRFLEKLAGKKK